MEMENKKIEDIKELCENNEEYRTANFKRGILKKAFNKHAIITLASTALFASTTFIFNLVEIITSTSSPAKIPTMVATGAAAIASVLHTGVAGAAFLNEELKRDTIAEKIIKENEKEL